MKKYYEEYERVPSITSLFILIDYFFTFNDIKCHYKLLYHELKKCTVISLRESCSMFDAMKILKTRIRHIGRNIKGRCIGTTLLTKGLEFDTVIIYDAHKISDAKNFYVAISRACKKLVIITAKTKFSFENIK